MGDSIPLHAVAYAQEGTALDAGAIILIPQDGQQMLLGDALIAGQEVLLGQLQPLTIASEHHQQPQHVLLQPMEQVIQQQQAQRDSPTSESEPVADVPAPTRAVSRALRVKWLDELLAKKRIACPVPGCPQAFTGITSVEKHYLYCVGVDGSGLEQCPYCEAQFLSDCNALHEHIIEEHPTRRALVHSSFNDRHKKPAPAFRRRVGGRSAAAMAPPPPKRVARPPGVTGVSTGTPSWDWENRRRTYSRSFDEPMGPTSDIFRRREEDDPLQLPKAMLNKDITMSSEELLLDEVQLQEGVSASQRSEENEKEAQEISAPEVDTIRLESMVPSMRDTPKAPRRLPRKKAVRGQEFTLQVIVKTPNTEGANALLRDPQVIQTLTNIATSTAQSPLQRPPVDPPSVVAVQSTPAEDGHYIQTEQALGPRTLKPAEVDRFFGGRVDCSCQTDDLPAPPQPHPVPQPSPMPFAPAILKRQRGLPQRPSVATASCAPRPLAVSIVCSSQNSSSDEDEAGSKELPCKIMRRGSDMEARESATEQATTSLSTTAALTPELAEPCTPQDPLVSQELPVLMVPPETQEPPVSQEPSASMELSATQEPPASQELLVAQGQLRSQESSVCLELPVTQGPLFQESLMSQEPSVCQEQPVCREPPVPMELPVTQSPEEHSALLELPSSPEQPVSQALPVSQSSQEPPKFSEHAGDSTVATDSSEPMESVIVYETTEVSSAPSLVDTAVVSEEPCATALDARRENTALRESSPDSQDHTDIAMSSIEESEVAQSNESFLLGDDNLPGSAELVICLPEEVSNNPSPHNVLEIVTETSRQDEEITSGAEQRTPSPNDVERSSTVCKVHDSLYERRDVIEPLYEKDYSAEPVTDSDARLDEGDGLLRTCYISGDDVDSQSSSEALQIVESLGEEETLQAANEAPTNGEGDQSQVQNAGSGAMNEVDGSKTDTGHFLVLRGGRRVAASIIPQIPVGAGFGCDLSKLVTRHDVPRMTFSRPEARLGTGVEVRLESSLGLNLNAGVALRLELKLRPRLEATPEPEIEPKLELEPKLLPELAADSGLEEHGDLARSIRSDPSPTRDPQRRQHQPPIPSSPLHRQCPGAPSDQDTPRGHTPDKQMIGKGMPDKEPGQQSPAIEEGRQDLPDPAGLEGTEPSSDRGSRKRPPSDSPRAVETKRRAGSVSGEHPNADPEKNSKEAEQDEETVDEQPTSSSEELPVSKRAQRKKRNPPKRDPMEGYASPEEGSLGRPFGSPATEHGRRQKATPRRFSRKSTPDPDGSSTSENAARKGTMERNSTVQASATKKTSARKSIGKKTFPDEGPSKRSYTKKTVGKKDAPKESSEKGHNEVVRKRGRPRKYPVERVKTELVGEDSVPKVEQKEDAVGENVTEESSTVVRRRRGFRKPLYQLNLDFPDEAATSASPPTSRICPTWRSTTQKCCLGKRKRRRQRKNDGAVDQSAYDGTTEEDDDSGHMDRNKDKDIETKDTMKKKAPKKGPKRMDGTQRHDACKDSTDGTPGHKGAVRKRGRPRKYPVDEVNTGPVDEDSVPKVEQEEDATGENIAKKSSKVIQWKRRVRTPLYKLNLDFPDEVPLVCSACKESFVGKDVVTQHVLHAHYNLARVNDETPLSPAEARSALRLAQLAVGRLACHVEGCGVSFASSNSYLSHLEKSHPELLPWEEEDETPEEASQEEPEQQGSSRKRRSALRALATFQALQEPRGTGLASGEEVANDTGESEDNVTYDSSPDTDLSSSSSEGEPEEEIKEGRSESTSGTTRNYRQGKALQVLTSAWQGWYVAHPADSSDSVSKELYFSWIRYLRKNKRIRCPKPNCTKSFSAPHGLKYHYVRCGENRGYKCVHCGTDNFSVPVKILAHLRGCVPERPAGDPVTEVEEVSETRRKGLATPMVDSDVSRLLARLHKWMINFQRERQNWEETLFPSWRPKDWVLLDEKEAEAYLPRQRESPRLRFQTLWKKTVDQEESAWRRLSLFESVPPEGGRCHATFFAGGAIWAGGWCPTPPQTKGGFPTPLAQWVVLACCPDPELAHPLTEARPEAGLLQFWGLGALESTRAECSPRLGLAMAHDFGFVADLCWCPSGCWEAEDSPSDEITGMRRLGLLALACGDGTVRIVSVPVPEDLPHPPEGGRPLFRAGDCSAILRLGRGLLGTSPCTRVSWDPHRKHRVLAAGYGDGRVALFDLVGKGPLLGAGELLWVLQAHATGIMGLAISGGALYPHLSTASLDQEAKVWPLERPGVVPTTTYKRWPIRSLTVSPHWNGVFVAGEESAVWAPALAVFKENGYYNYMNKTLTAHMCTVWSISVSPWTNAAATGDAGGELGAMDMPFLASNLDSAKNHVRARMPIYRLNLAPLSGEEPKQTTSRRQGNSRVTKRAPAPSGPTSLESALADYGLIFNDAPLNKWSDIPAEEVARLCHHEGTNTRWSNQYPLNSINMVSWSPNWSSSSWLLSGGQAGIARLSCVGMFSRCSKKHRTKAS
ncbi:unnamed protein product [Ixodes hexagonus]